MNPTQAEHDALAQAIKSGDDAVVEVLIQRFPTLVNAVEWTPPPLHCAVLWDQPEIAAMLLDAGAELEMLDPDRRTTPLRYAVMHAKSDLVSLLLSRGAEARPIVPGGLSALQLAREAAAGAFEEYEDLPRRDAYHAVVRLLEDWEDRRGG